MMIDFSVHVLYRQIHLQEYRVYYNLIIYLVEKLDSAHAIPRSSKYTFLHAETPTRTHAQFCVHGKRVYKFAVLLAARG